MTRQQDEKMTRQILLPFMELNYTTLLHFKLHYTTLFEFETFYGELTFNLQLSTFRGRRGLMVFVADIYNLGWAIISRE